MITVREAKTADAWPIGAILAAFQHQADWMPVLYSQTEASGYCMEMISRGWVRVAERFGVVLGFIAVDGEEVCALYVSEPVRGKGIGLSLIHI